MLPHRAGSQRMVRGGVHSRPDTWQTPAEMCGSHMTAKMQREGLGTSDDLELYFETQHNGKGKGTLGSLARAVSEARAGVSNGGRQPVGGRQPDRTPFFQVTPALRKNGYVLSGVDGTRPPTRN